MNGEVDKSTNEHMEIDIYPSDAAIWANSCSFTDIDRIVIELGSEIYLTPDNQQMQFKNKSSIW